MDTHTTPEEDQLAQLHSRADAASHRPHPLDAAAEAARHNMLYGNRAAAPSTRVEGELSGMGRIDDARVRN